MERRRVSFEFTEGLSVAQLARFCKCSVTEEFMDVGLNSASYILNLKDDFNSLLDETFFSVGMTRTVLRSLIRGVPEEDLSLIMDRDLKPIYEWFELYFDTEKVREFYGKQDRIVRDFRTALITNIDNIDLYRIRITKLNSVSIITDDSVGASVTVKTCIRSALNFAYQSNGYNQEEIPSLRFNNDVQLTAEF